jgi:proteic killer suppression protein
MIKTFADRHTKELYETGKSKRLPPAIWKRTLRKLEYLDPATGLDDLKVPLITGFMNWRGTGKGNSPFP